MVVYLVGEVQLIMVDQFRQIHILQLWRNYYGTDKK